ncbi:MAG: thiamine pyrophosphate-dependent dehydrogenase E1 component subunit alpha [Verrucomicrobiales bacterium]
MPPFALDTGIPPLSQENDTPAERFRCCFRWMLLSRLLEERIARLYRAGKIVGGVYLGRGQEAFSAAMGLQLRRDQGDIFAGLIRDMAGRLAFGETLIDIARTYLGAVDGPMRGRDGNIHRGRPGRGMPAMISHLGAMVSVVNGMLIAKRFRGETGAVGGTTIGDGGTSTGAFHEALNQAAVEKLPMVIAVADNQFAYSTPTDRQYACADLADRAVGYGVEGYSIDGTDLGACLDTFATAIARARTGHGPQLVVGHLLRRCGHGEHDDASYIPSSAKEAPYGGDCLELAKQQLAEQSWATVAEIEEWTAHAQGSIEKALATAQSDPAPDPFVESWHALSTKQLSEGAHLA